MQRFTLLFSFIILLSCNEKTTTQLNSTQDQKTVEVSINRTIETFMIVRSIAGDDPLFQYRDSTYKGIE
jgi:hypothetical protein